MRVALIQMLVTTDKQQNIRTACRRIREAAQNGADFAVLPEMFCCPYDNSCFAAYGEPGGGEAQTALARLAALRQMQRYRPAPELKARHAGSLGVHAQPGIRPEEGHGAVGLVALAAELLLHGVDGGLPQIVQRVVALAQAERPGISVGYAHLNAVRSPGARKMRRDSV